MYKVKNTSLDSLFEKFSIKSPEDLLTIDEDRFIEFFGEAHTLPFYKPNESTRDQMQRMEGINGPRYELDRVLSVERLVKDNSVALFMPIDYWRTEHKTLASQRDLYKALDKAISGEETLKLMCSIKVGINLEPGQEADANWTDDFVNKEIKNSPYLLKITVTKDGKAVDYNAPELDKKATEGIRIEDMDYRTLQEMAKEKGIPYTGIAKMTLIGRLVELRDTSTKEK